MRKVWVISDSLVSPLGHSSEENYQAILNGHTGITKVNDPLFSSQPFYASVLGDLRASQAYTRFETIAVEAARNILSHYTPDPEKTLFILSTTKGNVDLLSSNPSHERISLHASAKHISEALQLRHSLVVSNACISGVLALITAKRFLVSGKFDHALVVGAEVLSSFIISGFQSLQALSPAPCKPFDKNRCGISLGEAAGAMLLTTTPGAFNIQPAVEIIGEGLSNDANHISGPSRTGQELAMAVSHALHAANITADQIDSISAHGTATLYNDEMEAKAFAHIGMENIPLNSLKGYYGHTLGAAGIIETIIATHALLRNEVVGTRCYETPGVSVPLNVTPALLTQPQRRILKTASGFGGCNAALILEKKI